MKPTTESRTWQDRWGAHRSHVRLAGAAALTVSLAAMAMPAASADAGSEREGEREETASGADEVLLVLDASGSMSETDADGVPRIEAAQAALHQVVDQLDEDQEVGLRVFASEISDRTDPASCTDSELVVEVDQDNRDDLREAIDDYEAVGGSTPLAYSLKQAAEDLSDEGNRTIVLVSDGEENCVPDPCETAQAIASEGIDLRIHTVGYNVSGQAQDQLECIAEAGDGQYFEAEDADSLADSITEASQDTGEFQLHGQDVSGGTNAGDAIELTPDAQYVDQFGEDTLYYRIPREMENSTVHVSAITHNESREDQFDYTRIQLQTWDSDRCSRDALRSTLTNVRDRLRTAHIAAAPHPESERGEDPCGDVDELVLTVEGTDAEDMIGQDFQLSVYEEPHAENFTDYDHQVSYDSLRWQDMDRDVSGAEDVEPGSHFANAPQLEPGTTYQASLQPGEIQVFEVDLEWGERLQAELFFPEPHDELADAIGSMGTVGLATMNPLYQTVDSSRATIFSHSSSTGETGTAPVAYENRYANNVVTLAGTYYLVIVADEDSDQNEYDVPYRLSVQTYSEDIQDLPEYTEQKSPEILSEDTTDQRENSDSNEDV